MRRWGTAGWAAMALLAATSAGSAPPAPPAADAVEAALAKGDYHGAALALDRLVAASYDAKGRFVGGPELLVAYGRYLWAVGEPASAAGVFDAAGGRERLPPAAALTLARVELMLGNLSAVPPALAVARQDAALADHVLLVHADLLLVTDPAAVPALLAGSRIADDWRGLGRLTQAALLTGDLTNAERLAQRAWAAAAQPGTPPGATAQAAVLLAQLAARRGDRPTMLSRIVTADPRSNAAGSIGGTVAADLPPCGDGIEAQDFVTVAVGLHHDGLAVRVSPLAASRTAVIARFMTAIQADRFDRAALGGGTLVMTVRCREGSPSRVRAAAQARLMAAELSRHGLLPSLESFEGSEEELNAAGRALDEADRQYADKTAPALFRLIARALDAEHGYAASAELTPAARLRVAELFERRARVLDGRIAPASLPLLEAERQLASFVLSDPAAMPAKLVTWARSADLTLIAQLLTDRPAGSIPGAQAFDQQVADRVLKELRPDDPLRRRLLTLLARNAGAAGDAALKAAWLRAAGEPPASCTFVAGGLTDAGITPDDFPQDARALDIRGMTVVQSARTPAGMSSESRIIVSAPAGVFDPVTEAAARRFRFAPFTPAKGLTGCRGAVTPVRWQLPEDGAEPGTSVTPSGGG